MHVTVLKLFFRVDNDSPRFQGSVPSALQETTPGARDLFAVPSARAAR
jgi:hypothetical protein